jgi:hypothetical protein
MAGTIALVTHDPEIAAVTPRRIEIRDGKIASNTDPLLAGTVVGNNSVWRRRAGEVESGKGQMVAAGRVSDGREGLRPVAERRARPRVDYGSPSVGVEHAALRLPGARSDGAGLPLGGRR